MTELYEDDETAAEDAREDRLTQELCGWDAAAMICDRVVLENAFVARESQNPHVTSISSCVQNSKLIFVVDNDSEAVTRGPKSTAGCRPLFRRYLDRA